MPTFMDFHSDLKLSKDALRQITDDAQMGKADQFGVRQIDLFHNEHGHVYCLLEAPSAEAVRMHHEAMGVPCGNVHQVDSIR
ncbi:MAG: nickel-binding protein [Candidatus Xenobia bacterium]